MKKNLHKYLNAQAGAFKMSPETVVSGRQQKKSKINQRKLRTPGRGRYKLYITSNQKFITTNVELVLVNATGIH